MTRSVADAHLMYSLLNPAAAPFKASPSLDLEDYPLIISEDLGVAPVDDDVRQTFRGLLKKLKKSKAELIDDHPGLPSSVITWAVTASFDAAKHAKDKTHVAVGMGDVARGFIDFGGQFTRKEFNQAQEYRHVIRDAYQSMFERNNACILITPTLGCEAFPHGSIHPHQIADTPIEMPWLDWAGFLYDANLAGLPACAIPMGIGDEGLPLSLQILGPAGSDAEVLRVAEAIEALIGWQHSVVIPQPIAEALQQSA